MTFYFFRIKFHQKKKIRWRSSKLPSNGDIKREDKGYHIPPPSSTEKGEIIYMIMDVIIKGIGRKLVVMCFSLDSFFFSFYSIAISPAFVCYIASICVYGTNVVATLLGKTRRWGGGDGESLISDFRYGFFSCRAIFFHYICDACLG